MNSDDYKQMREAKRKRDSEFQAYCKDLLIDWCEEIISSLKRSRLISSESLEITTVL